MQFQITEIEFDCSLDDDDFDANDVYDIRNKIHLLFQEEE